MTNTSRFAFAMALLGTTLWHMPANAQVEQFRRAANDTTVGIISGTIKGTYARFAQEMSQRLDKKGELRIIAMLGRGSIQNMSDLLWLKGVDMAIVQSDVLANFSRDGAAGVKNIHNSVRYITKLYDEELHLVASKSIQSIDQLNGKRISVGNTGSGTTMTSLLLLNSWGIDAETINMSFEETSAKLKSGEVDAAFMITGKPAGYLQEMDPEGKLHVVPVQISPDLAELGYLKGELNSNDYPNLIPAGTSVETIAVGAVLAVYNWSSDHDKYRRLSVFSKRLIEELDSFKENTADKGGSYHPKWAQVYLPNKVPSWTRFSPTALLIGE